MENGIEPVDHTPSAVKHKQGGKDWGDFSCSDIQYGDAKTETISIFDEHGRSEARNGKRSLECSIGLEGSIPQLTGIEVSTKNVGVGYEEEEIKSSLKPTPLAAVKGGGENDDLLDLGNQINSFVSIAADPALFGTSFNKDIETQGEPRLYTAQNIKKESTADPEQRLRIEQSKSVRGASPQSSSNSVSTGSDDETDYGEDDCFTHILCEDTEEEGPDIVQNNLPAQRALPYLMSRTRQKVLERLIREAWIVFNQRWPSDTRTQTSKDEHCVPGSLESVSQIYKYGEGGDQGAHANQCTRNNGLEGTTSIEKGSDSGSSDGNGCDQRSRSSLKRSRDTDDESSTRRPKPNENRPCQAYPDMDLLL